MIGMLKTCYKKANSKDDFFDMLNECRLSTYIRGGRISGVVFSERKFRLKTLGFTEDRIEGLNHELKKNKEMQGVRIKKREINPTKILRINNTLKIQQ